MHPNKATVDSAQTKDITVTFTPHQKETSGKEGSNETAALGKTFETVVRLSVRGDANTTYTTTLKAFIVK